MIKIMIVDDELPIREWMEFVLNKIELPIEITGTISNGEDALELFRSNPCDLVFTDIKMPLMDGIGLLKEIKQISMNTTVVMLTSHTEFEYAKNSLNLGADHFLLKTEINTTILQEIIEKCIADKTRKYSPVSFSDVRYYSYSPESAQHFLSEYGSKITAPFFLLCTFTKTCNEFAVILNNLCVEHDITILLQQNFSEDITLFALSVSQTPSQLFQLRQYELICRELQEKTTFIFSVSNLYLSQKEQVPKLLGTILGLNYRFYNQKCSCFHQADYVEMLHQKKILSNRFHAVATQLISREYAIAKLELHAILEAISTTNFPDVPFIKKQFSDILEHYKLISFGYNTEAHNISSVEIECDTAKQNCFQSETFSEFKKHIKNFLNCDSLCFWENFANYSHYVQTAIMTVWENYATIEKTSEISDILALNNEYFCRLFKNETGITFNKFLTDYRLSIAENLLKNSDKKINEIAELVGYHNFSYFSKLYKLKYGNTPFKHRKS